MDRREEIIRECLGKAVHVQVDRPVGYLHGDILYPVNYGYVPGLFAADGEEQDAYILGVSEPLTAFDGRVIGVIRRLNDCEDKLVVAPEGMLLHQAQIAEAVWFQERYFDTTVDSVLRKSCGVIPIRYRDGQMELLVLQQISHGWSFPKGHMEPGETEVQTALRELREETGLTAELDSGVSVTVSYTLPNAVKKEVTLFPAEVTGDVVLQQREIEGCRWVKPEELGVYLAPGTVEACRKLLKL